MFVNLFLFLADGQWCNVDLSPIMQEPGIQSHAREKCGTRISWLTTIGVFKEELADVTLKKPF